VVTTCSPTINPVLRTFEIKGEVSHAPTGVVPGAMAELTLVFETRQSLGVPAAAVLLRNGRPVVFVAADGRAVLRAVETGWQNDGWVEILTGLEAGEAVITEGQTQLTDGGAIEVI